MESLPVGRKSCLLRIRENCPFRKLRRQTYDVLSATSTPIGSYWNDVNLPTSLQPVCSVHPDSLPPPPRSAADVHMEDDPAAGGKQNHEENSENQEDCMDLDDDIDPETGERAQG